MAWGRGGRNKDLKKPTDSFSTTSKVLHHLHNPLQPSCVPVARLSTGGQRKQDKVSAGRHHKSGNTTLRWSEWCGAAGLGRDWQGSQVHQGLHVDQDIFQTTLHSLHPAGKVFCSPGAQKNNTKYQNEGVAQLVLYKFLIRTARGKRCSHSDKCGAGKTMTGSYIHKAEPVWMTGWDELGWAASKNEVIFIKRTRGNGPKLHRGGLGWTSGRISSLKGIGRSCPGRW